MNLLTPLLASADSDLGATLLIVDWNATLGSLAFLAAALLSLYAARNPGRLVEKSGGMGLVAGLGFALLFATGCAVYGAMALASGTLSAANGEVYTGSAAYGGGAGFIALGIFLSAVAWRNMRMMGRAGADAHSRNWPGASAA